MSTINNTPGERPKVFQSIQRTVYIAALRQRFITLSEVKVIAGREATARMILWRLSRIGQLVRVKEGLYAAIPPEHVGSDFEVDRYILIDREMASKGALAFHSALELHGTSYSQFSTVYYLSQRQHKPFDFQDITYRVVASKQLFGITKTIRNGIGVPVTDKERTFLDCIRRTDLCGGLEEYLKSVEGFTLMSPLKLMDYLERFDEQTLYQRAGLILDLLKGRIKVQEELLDIIKARVGPTPCYLLPGRRTEGGKLMREWNVIVPENLSELMRFV